MSVSRLWALGLFHLHREALRAGTGAAAAMTPAPDRSEPYPGLLDRPFVLASVELQAVPAACVLAVPPAETAAEYWVTTLLVPSGFFAPDG